MNIQVYIPGVMCQAPDTPVESICETKSTNQIYLSSEGTGCDNKLIAEPYRPKGLIPDIKYLTYSTYFQFEGVPSCEKTNSTSLTVTTLAADGKCHVYERDSSFKATCNDGKATVQYCWY
jgi:hypothetical protein